MLPVIELTPGIVYDALEPATVPLALSRYRLACAMLLMPQRQANRAVVASPVCVLMPLAVAVEEAGLRRPLYPLVRCRGSGPGRRPQ